MSEIKYASVHENEHGERRIKPGKDKQSHNTVRIPTPDNDLESMQRTCWERVGFWELPKSMPKSEFPEWWNEHLHTDDEPEVIDKVLQAMGERQDGDGDE